MHLLRVPCGGTRELQGALWDFFKFQGKHSPNWQILHSLLLWSCLDLTTSCNGHLGISLDLQAPWKKNTKDPRALWTHGSLWPLCLKPFFQRFCCGLDGKLEGEEWFQYLITHLSSVSVVFEKLHTRLITCVPFREEDEGKKKNIYFLPTRAPRGCVHRGHPETIQPGRKAIWPHTW